MKKIKNEQPEILSGTVKAGPREDFAGKVNEDKPAAEPTREEILEAALVASFFNFSNIKCCDCSLITECLDLSGDAPKRCRQAALLVGENLLQDARNGEGLLKELSQKILRKAGAEHLFKKSKTDATDGEKE